MIVIDMDMPKNCTECPVFDHITGQCLISAGDCPIKCDIEDIKAQIQRLPYQQIFESVSRQAIVDVVLEIIDRHISEEGDHE